MRWWLLGAFLLLLGLGCAKGGRPSCSHGANRPPAADREIDFVAPRAKLQGVGPIEIGLGEGHACALVDSGQVACWGSNILGQVSRQSHGVAREKLPPTWIEGIDDASHLAVSSVHACVSHRSGGLSCWGSNVTGELGGTASASTEGSSASYPGRFRDLVAMHGTTCGMVPTELPQCFGQDENGRLLRVDPPSKSLGGTYYATIAPMAGVAPMRQLVFGGRHACALFDDGTVSCWGLNNLGQLGPDAEHESAVPHPVAGLRGVVQLDAGYFFTCALRRQGTVSCWGENEDGQLGVDPGPSRGEYGPKRTRPEPAEVPGLDQVSMIATGSSFACALREDGTVWCWGGNAGGQLGDGTTTSRPSPAPVAKVADVLAIDAAPAAKKAYACALTRQQTILCWGHNGEGELGDRGLSRGLEPVPIVLP